MRRSFHFIMNYFFFYLSEWRAELDVTHESFFSAWLFPAIRLYMDRWFEYYSLCVKRPNIFTWLSFKKKYKGPSRTGGTIRILQNLRGGSDKFYCDTTKIPDPSSSQVVCIERSLRATIYRKFHVSSDPFSLSINKFALGEKKSHFSTPWKLLSVHMVQRDGKTALRPMASEIACATGYFASWKKLVAMLHNFFMRCATWWFAAFASAPWIKC